MNTLNTKKEGIPILIENPKGLHARYYLQKIIGYKALAPAPDVSNYSRHKHEWKQIFSPDDIPEGTAKIRPMLTEVDEDAEYFIMRLDKGGSDPEHIKACRIGVHAYANAIEHHLPQLADDLRNRYPLEEHHLTVDELSKEQKCK
jgi:hypothetical protein